MPAHSGPGSGKSGVSGLGVKTELTYSNPTGDTVSSPSLRHLGRTSPRHAPPLPSSSTATSRPAPEFLGNTGGSRTADVQYQPRLSWLAHRDTPHRPTHLTGQGHPLPKERASETGDLWDRSQRPACLLHSQHSGRPTVGVSRRAAFGPRPGRAAPRTSFQEPSCALHAGACSCLSSPIILPFLVNNCFVYWARSHGEFLS